MASGINSDSSRYCFIDLDLDRHREKLATAAAFVDATDSRYGFTTKDLRLLGGSEISRVKDLITTDHEWNQKAESVGGIETRPPVGGNRIVVELYWDVAPLACENFATLCANGSVLPFSNDKKPKPVPTGTSGKPLTYRGSTMHRCVPEFVLQGGDFVKLNGSGGESIFKKNFKDEKAGLNLKHDQRYVLSMGNSGKNSNSSQFFFTLNSSLQQLDGKHVVFGRAISGFEAIDEAEKLGTKDGDPTAQILITDCGIYEPLQTAAAGYWYDTPDPDSFSGISPIFMVLPRIAVLAPNQAVIGKFQKATENSALVRPVSVEDYQEEAAQIARLEELLGTFAVDCVVVAPVCKPLVSKITLPKAWTAANVQANEVILEAKPVDAAKVVQTQTWLARQSWRLEGTTP